MAKYILKRKSFTKWDETDNLKRMKDSDILAEQKKKQPGYGSVMSGSLGGAAVGGIAGAAAGGLSGLGKKGARIATAGARASKLGKLGAVGGALLVGGKALKDRNDQAQDNNFYNKRLAYAQRQAVRREKKDWKSNMTQRDGYSY
jgi:hypothetical protein